MIVPQYWAQARKQHRERGRQITVRRFGWSDESEAHAQAMAEERAAEALRRVVAGERLPRNEPKVPYNGAHGVPIREQIVERHGDVVITRNAYGARCLNTPDVLFADIDLIGKAPFRLRATLSVVLAAVAWIVAWWTGSILSGALGTIVALLVGSFAGTMWQRARTSKAGGEASVARARVERFAAEHPEWGIRLYRTPNGWRTLVTHRLFAPGEPEVTGFFNAIGADPLYVRMCRNQQCFRARLSAKPWRIGIGTHLKPRPGVWPVRSEALGRRNAWIEHYEREASRYAACTFVASLGNQNVDAKAQMVSALHDESCRATTAGLPLA